MRPHGVAGGTARPASDQQAVRMAGPDPPSSVKTTPAAHHLTRVAEFLAAVDPESGQLSFFPYQFEVIPIELISSIYEQFAHAEPWTDGKRTEALQNGVHYTRLSVVVSLILDEVMDGLSGRERCWI